MLRILDWLSAALNLGPFMDAAENAFGGGVAYGFSVWLGLVFLPAYFYVARQYALGRERAEALYRLRDYQPCYPDTFRIRKWQNVTRS